VFVKPISFKTFSKLIDVALMISSYLPASVVDRQPL